MDETRPDPGSAGDGDPRAVAQLRMLHSLAWRLNELNDVSQIGEAITTELRTVIDYHNCRVHLISDDGLQLIPIAFGGLLTEYEGETFDALLMEVGEGMTGRVAATGESLYVPNTAVCDFAQHVPGTPDVDETALIVPLLIGSRTIGTVALSKLGVDRFDLQDQRLLEVLASHAAVAIENARLLQSERESARTANELLQFSDTLARLYDLPAVMTEALRAVPSMVPCAEAQAYLRDTATGEFGLIARQGVLGEGVPLDAGGAFVVPREVAQQFMLSVEEPFILTREVVASVPAKYMRLPMAREVLVAPIRWGPGEFGAIVLFARSDEASFAARDLELARGIAGITALALGNAGRMQKLREAADRLRQLDEMKNMFLDAVSHELRTPLAAVLGIALTLGRDDVGLSREEERDLIMRLVANARKLDRLLSDLLDLDRLARGIIEPVRRSTDVAALVRGVAENADFLNGRRITVDAEPAVVDVEPAKVERIVENLLSNTARHTPPDGSVWLRVRPMDGGALITVDDDGPGVPDELKAAIFEPFRQGAHRDAHAPGVGIGLSLVAQFAALHGGRAWVEDRPGGGASFRVFLPKHGETRADLAAPAA